MKINTLQLGTRVKAIEEIVATRMLAEGESADVNRRHIIPIDSIGTITDIKSFGVGITFDGHIEIKVITFMDDDELKSCEVI